MAGTRSAGTVDGTPGYLDVSLHWIDAGGDLRSDSYQMLAASTNANIEAFVAAMVLASNASLWKVNVGHAYSSVPQAVNAATASHESADDVINILFKTASNAAQSVVIRAPLQTLFVGDTEEVDVTDALFSAIGAGAELLLDGTYVVVSYRFTERREIGKRQRV